jgi:hypothetical protein
VLNPLRSEGEAFRLLLYTIVVAAVIIVLIVILRAVLGVARTTGSPDLHPAPGRRAPT